MTAPAAAAGTSGAARLASVAGAPRAKVDPAWIVAGMAAVAVAMLVGGAGGRLSNYLYVIVTGVAGLILYARNSPAYVSYTLWLWFVSPFVRRALDMHHGWSPASPVLIAAPAVALISVVTVLRRIGELRGALYAPYLLVMLAFGYGFAVGMINAGLIPATYALVTWLAPAIFGLHCALNWRRYPELAQVVRTTFYFALPLLAAYGLYQFVRMPRWDALWMINSDLRSIGAPRPFLARIFGTLNTPGPFAAFLAAGSLMLLPMKGRLRSVSIAVAIVALLLTRTRAVWIAFVIGLLVQQVGQPLVKWPRYLVTLAAVALLAIPVATMPQFSGIIGSRLKTFANLSEDNSFKKRYNFSEQAASAIVETAEGSGLGTTGGAIKLRGGQGVRSLDNGFLEVFYIFGWPGGAMFFLGILAMMLQSLRFRETRSDPFANATRATTVALVSILPIGDVFTGSTGTLLWMAAGFGLAAHAYHLTTGQALRSRAAARRALAPPPPLTPAAGLALLERPARP